MKLYNCIPMHDSRSSFIYSQLNFRFLLTIEIYKMLKFVKLRNLLPCKRALSSVTCDVTNSTHSLLGLVRYLRCCRSANKERERALHRERGEWESDRQATY